jgi:microcystin-dependent protein
MPNVTVPNLPIRVVNTVGTTPTTGPFNFAFSFFSNSDILVYNGSTLLTSGYTVTGLNGGGTITGGFEGGSVTLTAPVSNTTITVLRNVIAQRTTDFPTVGPFAIDTLNVELDKIIAIQQQQVGDTSRNLRQPALDTAAIAALPAQADRAFKVLGFDANGDPIASTATLATIETGVVSAAASAAAAAVSASEAASAALVSFSATSVSSVAIGTGTKTFTVQTGKGFVAGTPVLITDAAAPTVNFMNGTVTSYISGSGVMAVTVTAIGGSGTLSNWNIVVSGPAGALGATGGVGPAGSLGAGGSLGGSLEELLGPDIASAATTNIWDSNGNYRQITGTTTITSFGTAPQAGAQRVLRFASALQITGSASLLTPFGASLFFVQAGDIAVVRADSTTNHRIILYSRANGTALDIANGMITREKESDDIPTSVSSSGTIQLGAVLARTALITGTTAITSLGTTGGEGRFYRVRFAGALTLTHNATSLILPGGANITTAAGDVAEFIKESAPGVGNWRCTYYTRANGQPIAGAVGSTPSGMLAPFAGSTAPAGWLLTHGQAVSRTTYAALFAVISTTYGVGDGSTTFNLPDLRGRVVAGVDNMGGTAANRITSGGSGITGTTLGASGGMETHSLTIAQLAAHTHSGGFTSSGGPVIDGGSAQNVGSGTTTGSQGSGSPHQNTQPTIVLNYIIKE